MGKYDKFLATLQSETTGQFMRFAAVGAINTVVDFGIYVALTRLSVFWGAHIVLAAVASFSVAVFSSFVLNNFWTFRQRGANWRTKIVKFSMVATGGMLLNAVILFMFTRVGMHDLLAKAVATGFVMVWNFVLQKRWTFKMAPARD